MKKAPFHGNVGPKHKGLKKMVHLYAKKLRLTKRSKRKSS